MHHMKRSHLTLATFLPRRWATRMLLRHQPRACMTTSRQDDPLPPRVVEQQDTIPPQRDASVPKKAQRIVLHDDEVTIKAVTGWGKGGQAVNRTKNAIQMTHLPTGIVVKCHDTRSTISNTSKARKMLIAKLDARINGDLSKRAVKEVKAKKRNAKKRQRTRKKYHAPDGSTPDA